MGRYVVRRLLHTVPVLFGATFLIFALVFALPGDPVRALAGSRPLSDATEAALRDRFNLDDPLPVQYGKYLAGLARGDFGETFRGRSVADVMRERFPVTLTLSLLALVIEAALGLGAGIVAGIRRNRLADRLVLVSTVLLAAVPLFVLSFVGQFVFGLRLGWAPIAGLRQGLASYLLPASVLAAGALAYVARLTRASLAEVAGADYVRTAIAKGLPSSRVIGVHALRNALIPVVTFLGADLGALLSGAVIVEGIFNLPGVGQAVFNGVRDQDGPLVVGIVTVLVLLIILTNLAVDLLYGVLDPRMRDG